MRHPSPATALALGIGMTICTAIGAVLGLPRGVWIAMLVLGVGLLFIGIYSWGRDNRHDDGSTREVPVPARARRMRVELATIDGTVAAALDRGEWWDVSREGLPADKWDEGADVLDREIHDAVCAIYVEADLLNKAATRSRERGQASLDEPAVTRLERFRQDIEHAQARLAAYERA